MEPSPFEPPRSAAADSGERVGSRDPALDSIARRREDRRFRRASQNPLWENWYNLPLHPRQPASMPQCSVAAFRPEEQNYE